MEFDPLFYHGIYAYVNMPNDMATRLKILIKFLEQAISHKKQRAFKNTQKHP
jgi:hypothetical protein